MRPSLRYILYLSMIVGDDSGKDNLFLLGWFVVWRPCIDVVWAIPAPRPDTTASPASHSVSWYTSASASATLSPPFYTSGKTPTPPPTHKVRHTQSTPTQKATPSPTHHHHHHHLHNMQTLTTTDMSPIIFGHHYCTNTPTTTTQTGSHYHCHPHLLFNCQNKFKYCSSSSILYHIVHLILFISIHYFVVLKEET